jgi:CBS-domain-containing membrane protein
MLIVGFTGIIANMPWLFPSLGPTAYLQAETPDKPTARFYNTVIGHFIGLACGFIAVALFSAWNAPAVLTTHHLTAVRVWTSALALSLTLLGNLLLRSSHPPAGATTLLVALGTFKTITDAVTIVAGVLIVATFGWMFRWLRVKSQSSQ